eukprot:14895961-Ditylum_brightwellii.AAC.1
MAIFFNFPEQTEIAPRSKMTSILLVIITHYAGTILEEWDFATKTQAIASGEDFLHDKDNLELYSQHDMKNNR